MLVLYCHRCFTGTCHVGALLSPAMLALSSPVACRLNNVTLGTTMHVASATVAAWADMLTRPNDWFGCASGDGQSVPESRPNIPTNTPPLSPTLSLPPAQQFHPTSLPPHTCGRPKRSISHPSSSALPLHSSQPPTLCTGPQTFAPLTTLGVASVSTVPSRCIHVDVGGLQG